MPELYTNTIYIIYNIRYVYIYINKYTCILALYFAMNHNITPTSWFFWLITVSPMGKIYGSTMPRYLPVRPVFSQHAGHMGKNISLGFQFGPQKKPTQKTFWAGIWKARVYTSHAFLVETYAMNMCSFCHWWIHFISNMNAQATRQIMHIRWIWFGRLRLTFWIRDMISSIPDLHHWVPILTCTGLYD